MSIHSRVHVSIIDKAEDSGEVSQLLYLQPVRISIGQMETVAPVDFHYSQE